MEETFNPEEWGLSKQDQKTIELIIQLEQERKNLKLTQKQIAKRANITQGQLSRIENLESVPSLETINNIAEAMDKKLVLI
ncbi:helix-turn-helix domain-containing protein [Lacicoccus qingdaonensis]|uniref:Helix-turn-helix n=1 Tax=Lacicoccus qingdaonensis TaxID=576118 RepID=A0A1G9HNJ3_9BACL|nr:helix-turn-helix transcriptional regulator [Salinicoccus qingdaonensis]SDL14538.1 Helix-turn-helix [Salinicoccus qingdaonensis]